MAPGQVSDQCQIVLGANLANLGPYPFGRTLESVGNSRCGSNMAIFLIGAAPTAWVEALPDPYLYPRRFADALYCGKEGSSRARLSVRQKAISDGILAMRHLYRILKMPSAIPISPSLSPKK